MVFVEDAVHVPTTELVIGTTKLSSLLHEYTMMARMAWSRALYTALLLPSFCAGLVARADNVSSAPVATTKNGTYEGRYESSYGTDYFLGMPYAQPPVGVYTIPSFMSCFWGLLLQCLCLT